MNILIVHEVDWVKKVLFEPHHIAEKLSLRNNNVYVIDCRESDFRNLFNKPLDCFFIFQTRLINTRDNNVHYF